MVDEQFDAGTETQVQSLEALVDAVEESGNAYDEFATSYTELVDSSFDAYLDAHEQMETSTGRMAATAEEAAEEFDVGA